MDAENTLSFPISKPPTVVVRELLFRTPDNFSHPTNSAMYGHQAFGDGLEQLANAVGVAAEPDDDEQIPAVWAHLVNEEEAPPEAAPSPANGGGGGGGNEAARPSRCQDPQASGCGARHPPGLHALEREG